MEIIVHRGHWIVLTCYCGCRSKSRQHGRTVRVRQGATSPEPHPRPHRVAARPHVPRHHAAHHHDEAPQRAGEAAVGAHAAAR